MQRCTTFLWRMYHQVAEGMPDRFPFAKGDAKSATVAPHASRIEAIQRTAVLSADVDWSETEPMDESEQQDRAIAAIAASVAATHPADTKAIVGPGVASGTLRFLPPGKKSSLVGVRCGATRTRPSKCIIQSFLQSAKQVPGPRLSEVPTSR